MFWQASIRSGRSPVVLAGVPSFWRESIRSGGSWTPFVLAGVPSFWRELDSRQPTAAGARYNTTPAATFVLAGVGLPPAGSRCKGRTMSSLGYAIRRARMRADLSQGELAARVGVSQGTVSFWERDIEVPTLDNLVKLLAQFPDLLGAVQVHHGHVIQQLRQIERALFNGQCACDNCQCSSPSPRPSPAGRGSSSPLLEGEG